MTNFRSGDVVLVRIEFTDQSGGKWRPAVVVSSDRYNDESPDLLIVSVTGNLRALPHPGDYRIRDWQAAGLLRPSLAQAKVATVEASIIGRKLGSLSQRDLRAVKRGLREALAL
jgi:mRNA interferase MazF